ncbi:MAG: succinate--CoA ligase subunit alpha [Actinophytocola sp.]|nr:succinate--CoA ligase subunit alpha [Actinophytocola sp.]
MAIFVNEHSKVIVQGMTGAQGAQHTARMLRAGTNVVGGVNARKAGQTAEILPGQRLPVFGSVKEARAHTDADVAVLFVPPRFAKDAVIEAIDAEMELAVVITEGIPVHDAAAFWAHAVADGAVSPGAPRTPQSTGAPRTPRTRIIGPNCPGVISPGKSNVGIIPADITGSGPIGLVSKSGTLTYQLMYELNDIGFTTAVGIGGDPIIGTTHIDCLAEFERDPDTEVIVMIGEIGGDAEERAAEFIRDNVSKPVVAYVAGFTAPEGKTMGHAGAIVSGSAGTAAAKKTALEAAGVHVGKTPTETAELVRKVR